MLADIIPKIMGQEQEDSKYRHRCSNSTYGEKCLRSQCYHALGIPPEPFPDRVMMVFNDSSWHEELTDDIIRKSAYKLHSVQMAVTPFEINGIPVNGKIDGIITDLEETDRLFEHKAINHFTYQAYESGDLFPYDYICQCVLYLIGLKKVVGKILEALLLIKNKNTSAFIEYHIEYDEQTDIAKIKLFKMAYDKNELGTLIEVKEFFMEAVVARVKARYEAIDEAVKTKTLPARQYTIEDWYCQYCRWGRTCWANYEQEIEARKEGVVVKDAGIITKAAEYRKVADDINALDKVKDTLKTDLMMYCQTNNIKTGVAGENIVRLTRKESKKLNKDKIAPEIIMAATEKSVYEALTVTKYKEQKPKKGDK